MRNKIYLYDVNERAFANNGLGPLSDYIDASVSETLNAAYEMEMTYPCGGINADQLKLRRLLLCKANPQDQSQPFRIYKITEKEDGTITVLARHISYDLSGVPVTPFRTTSLSGAVNYMNSNSVVENHFTMQTNRAIAGNMSVDVPTSYRGIMGGMEGSILDTYGGEYHFDRFTVSLLGNRGTRDRDNPYIVTYKNNLDTFENNKDAEGTVSGVIGYWASTDEGTGTTDMVMGDPMRIDESVIPDTDVPYVEVLDLSEMFEEMPTVSELNTNAVNYAKSNGHHLYDINVRFTFADTPGMMNDIAMGDYVYINFSRYNVSATSRVVKTKFNVGENRFEQVEVGSVKASISDRITEQNREIQQNFQQINSQSYAIKKELMETVDMLRMSIANNEGNTSELRQTADMITALVSSINSSLSLTMSDQYAMLRFINNVNEKLENNISETDERFITTEKYIKAVDGSIVIGIAGGRVKMKLSNDTLAFYDGTDDLTDMSNAFAKFTDNELNVNAIRCKKQLFIGSDWIFYERGNGNLSLVHL